MLNLRKKNLERMTKSKRNCEQVGMASAKLELPQHIFINSSLISSQDVVQITRKNTNHAFMGSMSLSKSLALSDFV